MKIFGIGLPKTGLHSLVKALNTLKYSVIQYPVKLSEIEEYDVALDLPIVVNLVKLDLKYPDSKFILTNRDYDEWIISLKNHYLRKEKVGLPEYKRIKRTEFWGIDYFDEGIMKRKYYEYDKFINKYFEKRKDDLLRLNICGGEGWSKLCKFLDKPIPNEKFPHEYKGSDLDKTLQSQAW